MRGKVALPIKTKGQKQDGVGIGVAGWHSFAQYFSIKVKFSFPVSPPLSFTPHSLRLPPFDLLSLLPVVSSLKLFVISAAGYTGYFTFLHEIERR